MEFDIDTLATKIAAKLDPIALLDAEAVGALLDCAGRYVREEYMRAPGFPKPVRLTGPEGRRSQPKWRRKDIADWIDAHTDSRSKRGGRPRETPVM